MPPVATLLPRLPMMPLLVVAAACLLCRPAGQCHNQPCQEAQRVQGQEPQDGDPG